MKQIHQILKKIIGKFLTSVSKMSAGNWNIEFNVTIGSSKRNIRVKTVEHRPAAEKFDYALKLYSCMFYNPAFEDYRPQLERLMEAIDEMEKIYNGSRDLLWQRRFRAAEKRLDTIIARLHEAVEQMDDKEMGFIRSAGMEPEIRNPQRSYGQSRLPAASEFPECCPVVEDKNNSGNKLQIL